MERSVNKESYNLVCQYANKFAYGNVDSLNYEEYVSAGLKGLEKAIKYYKDDKDTTFKSFAVTCIVHAMNTYHAKQKKWDLTQDDNVELDTLDTLTISLVEENMSDSAKAVILRANKGNQRNAEIFMLNIGMNGNEPMDYKELSAKFNVSTERIRQVCVNTRSNIKANSKDMELLYSYVG